MIQRDFLHEEPKIRRVAMSSKILQFISIIICERTIPIPSIGDLLGLAAPSMNFEIIVEVYTDPY